MYGEDEVRSQPFGISSSSPFGYFEAIKAGQPCPRRLAVRRLALVFLVVAVVACLVGPALFLDYLWEGAMILIAVLLVQAARRTFQTRRGRLASDAVTNKRKKRHTKLVVSPGHYVHLEIHR